MLKQEFLAQLRSGLEAASIEDIDECIEFYDEMISDRIESGMNEESAVAQMESIDSIISNYKAEKPVAKLIMDKVQKSHDDAKGKGKGALWIVLAIIGFPIWLPILIVVFALLLTLYIVLWCIVIAVFCVLVAIGAVALSGLFTSFAERYGGYTGAFGGDDKEDTKKMENLCLLNLTPTRV